MNHREPPHQPADMRKALYCLSLLLPVMAPLGVHALPRTLSLGVIVGRTAEPTPYLPATGAPPLRFREAVPPPDLAARPPAAAPPTPALTPTETSVAMANADAARSATVSSTPSATEPAPTQNPSAPDAAAPSTKTPAPILPDDTRPTVRPEDFLPYFQIPGSARHPADVTLLVPIPRAAPVPSSLPPSSATYTQTPK